MRLRRAYDTAALMAIAVVTRGAECLNAVCFRVWQDAHRRFVTAGRRLFAARGPVEACATQATVLDTLIHDTALHGRTVSRVQKNTARAALAPVRDGVAAALGNASPYATADGAAGS